MLPNNGGEADTPGIAASVTASQASGRRSGTTASPSTLLFSDTHYLRTADAYLRALERRRRAGLDLAVPSVASVFISRWDSAADPLLPSALHGSLGLAMAQKTYASHVQLLSDQRWQALAEAGARPQRVLWASTSTKNPDLPDTYYLGRCCPEHDRHRPGADAARLR